MTTSIKDSFLYSTIFRFILLFVFLTTFVSPLLAQGDLMIYPKRVVFDGNKKVEKLVLSNTGNEISVYNISFVEYKMNENGELKIITEPEQGQRFASTNVRFFPRKVTLAPNESQTVKVELIKTQDLTDGEYRSHLYFRAEEENAPLGENNKKKETAISVKLKAVFGISIPCIISIGENTTTVAISDLQFIKGKDINDFILQFNLNRNGNMSSYGDFTINYSTPDNKTYEVAIMKGVGVYTPNNLRYIKIKLNKPDNVTFTDGGSFKVIYSQNGKKKVLTEAIFKM